MLELRLLGPFEVLVDGEPVGLPPSRKTRALLAWLALAERPQRRERLCEVFWDIPDDPKGALRWSLSKIRRILGDDADRIVADRNAVSFRGDGAVIDAAAILGRTPESLGALSTESLEEIAASFRGDFLEDLALDRCPEYEGWRAALAFEAETARGRVLATLVDRLTGDPARALPHAEQLAALARDDPAAARRVEELRRAVRREIAPAAPSPLPANRVPPAPFTLAAPRIDPAAPPDAGIRYATARDGTRIAWAATGAGPPLVRAAHWMSHLAFDAESPVWRHWIRELSGMASYIHYDERCNGMSDEHADDLSLDAFVSDLEAVVDAAGLERFTLLGVSQSCAISVAYALRHPERVSGLVLYGGYAQGWRARGDPDEIAQREAILVLMRDGWGQESPMFREMFASSFVPGASREQMAEFSELQRRTVTPRNAIRLQHAFSTIDVTALLPRVSAPTLVLHALGDRVAPIASGRALAEGIPGARLVELDSDNHILLEHEPAFGRFLGEVRSFLETAGRQPVAAAVVADESATRRQVTVLDAELVTSMAALEILGAEAEALELAGIVERMRAAIELHGGRVIDSASDRLTAAFGADLPSEVHAVDACRAALVLRALVDSASEGSARVRIGIDTGDALVSGGALPIAALLPRRARQMTQSLRGAVVALSDEAAAAAGGYVAFSAIRPLDLAGGRRDRRMFELQEVRSGASRWRLRAERRLTAFTGRAAEIELMSACMSHALSGQGRTVFVSGEPGVGKSRLVHEFLSRCAGQGADVFEAGALEFDRNVPFALVRRLFSGLLGIEHGAAPDFLPQRVGAALAACDAGALTAPVLFALDLSPGEPGWEVMPPAERAHRVREALRRLVAVRARSRPLAILAEDLHWCDEASLEAISRLVAGIERLPVLLLATARPDFRPEWLQRSAVRPVNLDVLGTDEAHKMIRRLVGRHPSVRSLRRVLLERTDGTPLMIEETVGALVQSGRLRGETGSYVAREPIVEVESVTSVAPVIAARIARLEPAERQLLQLASVIGRDGPLDLLRSLAGLSTEAFDSALRAVEQGEFLYELLGRIGSAFTFKHALIRDAAYGSIPDARRRKLHERVFAALSDYPDRARDGLVEQLAHHAYVAGAWEAAVLWLTRAAERAVERSAYDRAFASLERAISALDALDPTPEHVAAGIDVRMSMQIACAALGDFEGGIAHMAEACAMAETAGDAGRLAHALLKLSYSLGNAGQIAEALDAAERLAAHAAANGLDYYVSEADIAVGYFLLVRGDAAGAMQRLLPNADRFDGAERHQRFGLLNTRYVWLKGCMAMGAALLGDFAMADAAIDQARAVARETNRPQDMHAVLQYALQIEIARGPSDSVLAETETILAESLDEWLFPAGPWLLAGLGEALIAKGRLDSAELVLERAWEAADAAGMRVFSAVARRLLAATHVLAGDPDARAELVESLAAETELPVWLQVRLRRMMAATTADDDEAARWLKEAADQARASGLAPYETACLAELAERLGRESRDAARPQEIPA